METRTLSEEEKRLFKAKDWSETSLKHIQISNHTYYFGPSVEMYQYKTEHWTMNIGEVGKDIPDPVKWWNDISR